MADLVTASPILTEASYFGRTYLVEVMRGCAHRCRFCLASYSMLPARGPSLEALISTLEHGLQVSDKIGLLGALIADHPHFPELCEYLSGKLDEHPNLTISAASLRADGLTLPMAQMFKKAGQHQLTIAIESGSELLRRRINKNLKQEAIFNAADIISTAGLPGLKLYGMIGLPDETDADIDATISLLQALHKQFPRLKLIFGCSSFVPKAWTPFQWMPRLPQSLLEARFKALHKGLLKSAQFRPSSAKWDYIQAVLSRGDRRLAPLLVMYYQLGSSIGSFNRAFKALRESHPGINLPTPDWYALRERPEPEILPWDVLHLGVDKGVLYKEGLLPPGWVREEG
jgi:radical SAM superfamily enzyme YgiQ (UPF0313 family)